MESLKFSIHLQKTNAQVTKISTQLYSGNRRSVERTYGDVVHSLVLTEAWPKEERGANLESVEIFYECIRQRNIFRCFTINIWSLNVKTMQ